MHLLESHHRSGILYEPRDLIEQGDRVAVGFGPVYKVFTFAEEKAVHLQDCADRDDALRRLTAY